MYRCTKLRLKANSFVERQFDNRPVVPALIFTQDLNFQLYEAFITTLKFAHKVKIKDIPIEGRGGP
jgi:hypothetical protein